MNLETSQMPQHDFTMEVKVKKNPKKSMLGHKMVS